MGRNSKKNLLGNGAHHFCAFLTGLYLQAVWTVPATSGDSVQLGRSLLGEPYKTWFLPVKSNVNEDLAELYAGCHFRALLEHFEKAKSEPKFSQAGAMILKAQECYILSLQKNPDKKRCLRLAHELSTLDELAPQRPLSELIFAAGLENVRAYDEAIGLCANAKLQEGLLSAAALSIKHGSRLEAEKYLNNYLSKVRVSLQEPRNDSVSDYYLFCADEDGVPFPEWYSGAKRSSSSSTRQTLIRIGDKVGSIEHLSFVSSDWIGDRSRGSHKRLNMLPDLLDKLKTPGRSRTETRKLLGMPDWLYPNYIDQYTVFDRGDLVLCLWIYFDRNEEIAGIRLRITNKRI